ncbi:MAG: hypothetical protein KatS3mg102_1146 [Planctomycetota bacterium]|nr:MAG: hypothetical protein KatS3mg102_1146 [Planctomycetota bacterium]
MGGVGWQPAQPRDLEFEGAGAQADPGEHAAGAAGLPARPAEDEPAGVGLAAQRPTPVGPRTDPAAQRICERRERAQRSLPARLGFADASDGVRALAERLAPDGQLSAADVQALVVEAGDFGRITEGERQALLELMRERAAELAPSARAALAGVLGIPLQPVAGGSGRGAPGPPYGSPEFERQLDRDTQSVARPDNEVRLLFDGVQSFAERRKLIENATDSIHLQTFIFTADETGWELAKLLAAKAQQGVKVRVIYDGLGSARSGQEIFEYMRRHGVEVREYGDPLRQFWDLNNRWHEKYLIVDGQAAITGGMNIANEYAFGGSGRMVLSRGQQGTEPWRDVDIRLQGPVVHDVQRAFLKNWQELGPPVSPGEQERLFPPPALTPGGPRARFVQHRPDEDGDENTTALYLHAIRSAEESITIENAYFIPPPAVRQALIEAARRGVQVRVLTNSRASNDMGMVSDAARYYYDELIAAGVQIYEKQGGTLHSKTATFDGRYSIVGSVNMNGRSDTLDSEGAVAVEDAATAATLQRRFAEGLGQAQAVTAAELDREGFFTNLKQWALSLLSWTF